MPTAYAAADMPEEMAKLARKLADGPYTPVLAAIKPVARQAFRDNFTSSANPDDQDWLPRKHPGDGHPLLIETGAMLQAATGGGAGGIEEIGTHDLTLGVDGGTIPYGAAQNYGLPRRNLPQREYMGMSEQKIDEADDLLADFVLTELIGE